MRRLSVRSLVWLGLLFSIHTTIDAQTNQAATSWFSPTSELNEELPHWLRLSGDERVRGEGTLGVGFKDSIDRYILQRVRLNLQVKATEWLKFDAQAQDARALWRLGPQKSPFRDTLDLRQAFVTIGGLEKYHAAFRVGRQELGFGDERLMGGSNWTNAARSFDGYRASFQVQKVRLDAFAASVVTIANSELGYHVPGNYIEGLYSDISDWLPKSSIQPYFFWRRSPGVKLGSGLLGTSHSGTAGIRWVGKLPLGFGYNTETAWQRGSINSDSVAAWASHMQLNYDLPLSLHSIHPVYVAEFNYASGDRNPKDIVHNTFDTLYASGHDKIDLADQVGWKNIRSMRTGMDFRLWKKTKLVTRYADLWLADAHDSLYASNGSAVVTQPNGSAGRWVGQEFAGTWTWSVTRGSQLGAGYAYLLPGTFLRKTTPGLAYSTPFLMYQTSF